MTQEGLEEAVAMVEAQCDANGGKPDDVIVVYLPRVHESLAGIIA